MIKEAIEKAVWGGYPIKDHALESENGLDFVNRILLDPLFWQALGKVLGWDGKEDISMDLGGNLHQEWETTWLEEWHRFIDHLAEGKDPDDFFKDLLTSSEQKG